MFKSAERIRETSTTTGTGTYTLGGAPTGYQPVSSIAANSYGPFFITDGTNWEVIIGQYLSGPDRLTRDAVIASSNSGSAVNWAAGTRTIRGGWPAWLALPRYLTKSVAGGAGTTVLTQNEQRGHVLEFTGALTGNRIIEVDATPWVWEVYNNTTGAFTLTVRVTGQTGVAVTQGDRSHLYCDGTDVRGLSSSNGEYRSVQVFTASGTYTKPAGLRRIRITVVGAGGGGGGANAVANSAGTGGGGGATSIKTIAAASVGATETVTVGTGGAGGNNTGGNASTGGNSSFGAHATANGGVAGFGGSGGSGSTCGTGGTASGGDINIQGGDGNWGVPASNLGGHGGGTSQGGGSSGGANAAGASRGAYGAGGGGAASAGGAGNTGGTGKDGIVIVEEFF